MKALKNSSGLNAKSKLSRDNFEQCDCFVLILCCVSQSSIFLSFCYN